MYRSQKAFDIEMIDTKALSKDLSKINRAIQSAMNIAGEVEEVIGDMRSLFGNEEQSSELYDSVDSLYSAFSDITLAFIAMNEKVRLAKNGIKELENILQSE